MEIGWMYPGGSSILNIPTDGVRDRLSGNKAISFIMFANRTGSSFRKKIYDFFSHAFSPAAKERKEENKIETNINIDITIQPFSYTYRKEYSV